MVYARGRSCSPSLTCSQSPARDVWQSCGWNGKSDWLVSQKSRSLSIRLLSIKYSQAESLQTRSFFQSSTAAKSHHSCLQRDQTHQRGKTCCSTLWRQELRGVFTLQRGHVDGTAGLQWVLSYNMICSTKNQNNTFQSHHAQTALFRATKNKREKKDI